MTPRLRAHHRLLSLGGAVGPAAFVAGWAWTGARRTGYSPVDDAISRLAADGTSTQAAMTAGFVAFGVGVPLYAVALRRGLPGPAWVAAAVTGVSTLGVAALPLDSGVDTAHGVAAVTGYVSLAAVPLLAAPALQRCGAPAAAATSVAAGALSTAALVATALAEPSGLWQRVGLTVVDAWLVVTALVMATRGRLIRP